MKRYCPNGKPFYPTPAGSQADFVIEGYVDPTEPLRDEAPFGNRTGYLQLPSPHEMATAPISRGEPYPVFHVTAITHRQRGFAGLLREVR